MFRKKLIIIGVILELTVIFSITYFSYAFFTDRQEFHGKLNQLVGNLNYKIDSNYLENDSIVVEAGKSKELVLDITSLNTISSEYELYYTSNVEVNIGYASNTESLPDGSINPGEIKKVTVIIRNTTSSDATITFGINGGLIGNIIESSTYERKITDVVAACTYQPGDVVKMASYSGAADPFSPSCDGRYKIELWGASGGESRTKSGWATTDFWTTYGYGGYSSGEISLVSTDQLYIYVGAKGEAGTLGAGFVTNPSFNGGGSGKGSSDNDDAGGSGGGATDIRLVSGSWDSFDSLKSRIMVAGGGSGSAVVSKTFTKRAGGSGGGLSGNGSIWRYNNAEYKNPPYNATQTSGYLFGKGEDGLTKGNAGGAGAGGGYYGGLANKESTSGGAGGGSGFISGYTGCDAISETSTSSKIVHTGSSIHYSNKVFENGVLKNGNEEIPTHDGKSTMIGNDGDGYAKITYLGP